MDNQLPEPTSDTLSSEVLSGMHEWRLQHPDATLREIEEALDQRWYRLRARILQDLALEREAANWQSKAVDRPTCRDCGRALIASSKPMVARPDPHTQLRLLFGLQERLFSSSMSNWPCCLAISHRSYKISWPIWVFGCRLPKRQHCLPALPTRLCANRAPNGSLKRLGWLTRQSN
jgi:hypothetical protein